MVAGGLGPQGGGVGGVAYGNRVGHHVRTGWGMGGGEHNICGGEWAGVGDTGLLEACMCEGYWRSWAGL